MAGAGLITRRFVRIVPCGYRRQTRQPLTSRHFLNVKGFFTAKELEKYNLGNFWLWEVVSK
jgi:hypothetical protein